MLHYVERCPTSDLLKRHVRCFWSLAGSGGGQPELITPDGCVELVIHLAEPIVREAGRQTTANTVAVVGPCMEVLSIKLPMHVCTIGVRFKPDGAQHFVPIPLRELSGDSVELEAVWGASAGQLADALLANASDEERFRILEEALLARLRPGRGGTAISNAVALIRRFDGSLQVAALAARLGRSVRSLQRDFEAAVGLSPKQFSRITRFRAVARSITRVRLAGPCNWAGLAAAFGYADQSHLIREFHQFAGTSPGQYVRQGHRLNDALIASPA